MTKTQLKKYKYILLDTFENPNKVEQERCRVSENTINFYKNISIRNLIVNFDFPIELEHEIVFFPFEVVCDNIKLKYEFRDPELYVPKKK